MAATSLHFELLFEKRRAIETERLLAGLRAAGHRCEVHRGRAHPDSVVLTFPDQRLPDGAGTPQLILVPAPRIRRQDLLVALAQTWTWMDAHTVVDECAAGVLVSDRLSHLLPRERRLPWLRSVLRVAFAKHPSRAIHCICSKQIVEPAEMLRGLDASPTRLTGLVNVRIFAIEGSDSAWLDTLGMESLGLPDLQCEVPADADLSAAGHRLYALAHELEASGLELPEGLQITGPGPDEVWVCAPGEARVGPKRRAVHLVQAQEDPAPSA